MRNSLRLGALFAEPCHQRVVVSRLAGAEEPGPRCSHLGRVQFESLEDSDRERDRRGGRRSDDRAIAYHLGLHVAFRTCVAGGCQVLGRVAGVPASVEEPGRARPAVAPQIAATSTPASMKARAFSAAAALAPASHEVPPGRISSAEPEGCTSSRVSSGSSVNPPIDRTGARVSPTVRTVYGVGMN